MVCRTLNSLPCGFLFSRKLVPSHPNFSLLLNSHFCFLSLVTLTQALSHCVLPTSVPQTGNQQKSQREEPAAHVASLQHISFLSGIFSLSLPQASTLFSSTFNHLYFISQSAFIVSLRKDQCDFSLSLIVRNQILTKRSLSYDSMPLVVTSDYMSTWLVHGVSAQAFGAQTLF